MTLGATALAASRCSERQTAPGSSQPYSESHRQLIDAIGKDHHLQARLCGGLPAGNRGKSTLNWASLRAAARAERSIDRELTLRRSPFNLAAAAAVALLRHRSAEAIALLEEASTTLPSDARLWSDLSAAFGAQAEADASPFAFVRAVSAADRALEVDPSLSEARFNLAQALEKLNLFREAKAAWCNAAKSGRGSGWTDLAYTSCHRKEAESVTAQWRAQSAQLDEAALLGDTASVRRLVRSNPQGAREHAVDDVLARWGESVLADREQAAADSLRAALPVGRELAAETGEFTVLDAVSAVRHLSGKRRLLAAQAYRDYAAGRRLYTAFDIEGATPLLQRAAALSNTVPNPEALWAELWLSGVAMYQARYDDAIKRFDTILNASSRSRYPSLAALAHWLLGVVRLRTGRVADALNHYRAAEAGLRPTREMQNLGGIESLTAEALDYLGQSRASWSYRYRALRALRSYPSSIQLQNLLRDSVRVLLEESEARAAIYFQRECARTAESSGNALTAADALLQGSRIEQSLGRLPAARDDLKRAEAQIHQIAGGTLRERMRLDFAWVAGTLEGRTSASRGLTLLTKAADYYAARHLDLNLEPVLLARARLWKATGDDRNAEADLRRGIELFESNRGTITDRGLRLSSLQTAVELFDDMMILQVDRRHDPEAAFEYAERARAALSLRAFSPAEVRSSGAKVHAAGLARALPAELNLQSDPLHVVEYAVLDDRLYIWCLDRHGLHFVDRRADIRVLREITHNFLAALRRDAPAHDLVPLASSLFDELVAPFATNLETGSSLIFVPDKFLNGVPFAALLDRLSQRYLLQDHPVAMAPQASLLLDRDRAIRHLPVPPAREQRVLLVASPIFNRQAFPWLEPLPGVEDEIVRLAAIYPGAVVLKGREATREAFLAALANASVLHFAGHAVATVADPDDAQIVLAPSKSPRGADTVSGRELRSRSYPKLQLVILSACGTAVPDTSRSGGLFGLARPFLESGAAAVVGTLWSVNDRIAPALLEHFHRGLAARHTAARSLRLAQLRLFHTGDSRAASPANWAAYCLIETRRD